MATRAGATVAEAAGSHAIYVSKPEVVAALIAKAAKSMSSQMAAAGRGRSSPPAFTLETGGVSALGENVAISASGQ
jgi:hypothetical protein